MKDAEIFWNHECNGGDSPPAIGFDGTLYLALDGDPHIFAISKSGLELWRYCYDPEIHTPNFYQTCGARMTISATGSLVVSCRVQSEKQDRYAGYSTKLLVLDATGQLLWEVAYRGHESLLAQAVAADGTIVFCAPGKRLCAFEPSGKLKWECKLGGKLCTSPRLALDDTIYVGASDKRVYAVDSDGSRKWDYQVGGSELREFSLGAGGVICLNTFDGEVRVVDANGKLQMGGIQIGGKGGMDAPVVCPDGTLLVCSFEAIVAISPNGAE